MKVKLNFLRKANKKSRGARKGILIVDDDELLARQMRQGLTAIRDYEVCMAHSCSQARWVARLFRPHFIFFDVDLQDGDGGGLAQELLSLPALRYTDYVFLTGLVAREEVSRNEGTIGGARFLAKPARPEELVSAIESADDSTPNPPAPGASILALNGLHCVDA